MTVELTQYTDRVPSANAEKPNFIAALSAILQPFVDLQNVVTSMPSKFDVDAASGAQLDVVGQWVGVSRRLSVPIAGVYFSFNTDGLGFNEGVWFNSEDPADGIIILDDETYRLMIYVKIAANTWDGSLEDANAKLAVAVEGAGLAVKDNMDMTMSLLLSGTSPTALFAELVAQGYIQLRPAGVGVV